MNRGVVTEIEMQRGKTKFLFHLFDFISWSGETAVATEDQEVALHSQIQSKSDITSTVYKENRAFMCHL